jgi:hypothetical protein
MAATSRTLLSVRDFRMRPSGYVTARRMALARRANVTGNRASVTRGSKPPSKYRQSDAVILANIDLRRGQSPTGIKIALKCVPKR